MPIYDTGPFYNDYANFKIAYVGINVTNLSPLSSAQIQIVIYNFSSLSGTTTENYPLPNYSPTASPLSLDPYTSTSTNNSAYQLIGISTTTNPTPVVFGVVGVRLYVTGIDEDQVIPCVTFLDSTTNVLRVCSAGDLSSVPLLTLTTAYVAASNTQFAYAFDVTTPAQTATSITLNTSNSRAITGNDTTVFVGGTYVVGGVYPIYAATNTVGALIPITVNSTARKIVLLNISPDGSTVFGTTDVSDTEACFPFKINASTRAPSIGSTAVIAADANVILSQLAVANSPVGNAGSLPGAYIAITSNSATPTGSLTYVNNDLSSNPSIVNNTPFSGVTAPVDSSTVYAVPRNTSGSTPFDLYLIDPIDNSESTVSVSTGSLDADLVSGRAAVDPTNNNIVYILYSPPDETTAPQVLQVTVTPGASSSATQEVISFNSNFLPNGTTFTAIATSKVNNKAYVTYSTPTSTSDGIVAFSLTDSTLQTYYTEGFANVDLEDIFIYDGS